MPPAVADKAPRRPPEADGLKELDGLEAMLFGRYNEAAHGSWRRGLGPPRVDAVRQISQQIAVICHVTAYERHEEDGAWLRQWAADQLCSNPDVVIDGAPVRSPWNTGIDGLEAGANHYGAFTRGVISRACQVALQRGDLLTAGVLTAWLRAALLWWALSAGPDGCATIGQRNQQHDATVSTAVLWSGIGLPVKLARRGQKLADLLAQPYYLPARIFRAGVSGGVYTEPERQALRHFVLDGALPLPASLAPTLEAIRVGNEFAVRRHSRGRCVVMTRTPASRYDDNGSTAYAFTAGPLGTQRLEPDVKRQPTPDTCEAHLDGTVWRATTTDQATGARASVELDTATLGPLLYTMTAPAFGPVTLTAGA
jgi:hypothetical protein